MNNNSQVKMRELARKQVEEKIERKRQLKDEWWKVTRDTRELMEIVALKADIQKLRSALEADMAEADEAGEEGAGYRGFNRDSGAEGQPHKTRR
jgi:hypothetical protein